MAYLTAALCAFFCPFPSLSVTLSIDETSRPSYLCSVATDPLEGSAAVVKQSS